MSKLSQLCVIGPALIVGSIIFTGCTASETMQEPSVSKSSVSTDMLTASIKAIGSSESQISNTSLTFFLSNNTEADKKLLIWNTPIENPLSADIFSVQFDGKKLKYQGRMIKRGSPQPEHFRVVEVGETLESVVDLSNYYDMSVSGSYTVSLDPVLVNGTYQLNELTPINLVPETLVINVP